MTGTCGHCGRAFVGNARKRFCSQRCQVAAWNQHDRPVESYVCIDCGGEFERRRAGRNANRPRCRRCAVRAAVSGSRNPNYNGGLSYDRDSGRWRIKARDGSTVYYARAVMEAHLRRELRDDEHVHHVNGDTSDDRLENLIVLDRQEHGRLHGYQSGEIRRQRKAAA